jgi:hypothetical protein
MLFQFGLDGLLCSLDPVAREPRGKHEYREGFTGCP